MSENEVQQKSRSLSDDIESIINDENVVQAFVIVTTNDNEYVRSKGHFYDNATLLNSILGDFKEKIYLDIFSGPTPKSKT